MRATFPTLAAVFLFSTLAPAQWIHYPTPGIPRLADGKPNLSAPAPRTADGHPDFSGIWDIAHNRACPPEGCFDMEIPQEFTNIGWSLKGGLPYQPWAAAAVKERSSANGKDDPGSHCNPVGIVVLFTTPMPRKFIQIPGLVTILYEHSATYRQIFTDGRPLPVDPQPSFRGYSTGRWERDTLVVESNGFRDGIWLDRGGSPLTDAARITERFRRPDFGHMDIELTVNDAKAYTQPWTVTLHQTAVVDTDLLDYICQENEHSEPHLVGR